MITVTNLEKTYGGDPLFTGVTLQMNSGERYGIVGANGSGKSTFLRILAGEETPTEGEVALPKRARIGFLRQDHFLSDAQPILEVAMMGAADVWKAMQEKEEILAKPEDEFDHERYAEVEDFIIRSDGYALEARAGEVLEGLGIPTAVHHQALSTLSGGFKLRVLLAQTLAAMPDALLLDEPTNHLDIVSVRWLEKFLSTFPGCVGVVSHDHRFLDNVCTRILDVDYETISQYPGNYSDFVKAKADHRERKEAEIEKREAEIAHHQAYIDRFKAKASKARQASSKKKLLDRVVIERLPQSSRRYPGFRFPQRRPTGKDVLRIEHLSKSYGDNLVLNDVSLDVRRGDRLAIIGPNGIGKSTLLKIAMGEVAADKGTSEWGHEVHPGYFAQDHRTQLDDEKHTVLTWLWDFAPGQTETWVRGQLGAVLFSREDVHKSVTKLSGGEAARLVFARFAVTEPNLLVLDEPTNHLDLEAIEALVKALKEYEGTLIFVSHDRWFVEQLATRVLELKPEGMDDYRGTYAEYLAHCGDDHLDADVALKQAKKRKKEDAAPAPKAAAPAPSLSKAERRKLTTRRDELAAAIEKGEKRVAEIEARFCEPGFFEKTGQEEVRRLQREQEKLQSKGERLLEEWTAVEERLDG